MTARSSISTLHARLNLPSTFSTETLQRCLVDKSTRKPLNNANLAVYGNHLLGYYITDHIVTRFPRLPYRVTKNALISYAGWKTLASIGREWGVEGVPNEDFKVVSRIKKPTRPGTAPTEEEIDSMLQLSRVGRGHIKPSSAPDTNGQYLDQAYADFVRAVVGGMAIHAGPVGVREFVNRHFLSRHIDLIRSFRFTQPQRELSALCAREGLERPTTRLIAETGRRSNSPVYIMGVYSGTEKLGEGQGASLSEAEFTAQSNAMKSWYLFEDKSATLPALALEQDFEAGTYKAAIVDTGDVIV